MITMFSLSTIVWSEPGNNAFLSKKCGGIPSILIVGPPNTGKSTQTRIKNILFGILSLCSILVCNEWNPSSLASLRDQLPGIPITYVTINI